MKPNAKEVGARIKNIRLHKGLTMEEFGKIFNPPACKSVVSNWERGNNLPNNARSKILAVVAGIPVEELLYGKRYILEDFETWQLLEEIQRRLSE